MFCHFIVNLSETFWQEIIFFDFSLSHVEKRLSLDIARFLSLKGIYVNLLTSM